MKLKVYNRQRAIKISREILKLIEKAGKLTLKGNGFLYPCEAFITIIDNDTISGINLEQRGINAETDVLSFPMLEFEGTKPVIQPGDADPETDEIYLGEILISAEKAVEQAGKYKHSFEREICFLAVHGMLHLIGFDHEEKSDEKEMIKRQEAVLAKLGLTREDN